MGCFVSAGFLLTDALYGPSAIAELHVIVENSGRICSIFSYCI